MTSDSCLHEKKTILQTDEAQWNPMNIDFVAVSVIVNNYLNSPLSLLKKGIDGKKIDNTSQRKLDMFPTEY